ncbi:hypothetical protein [Chryseolinea soli]|uniref:Uncharacterized protein n=1 Tax=Chryseolinea soli TaxID=2321403 RepID=A0A385SUY5_9BACT|nr:hypothetical protein [Chryseolinea soli]AYB33520.1 hypothetical protein D4L85_24320 [Chryseolinea soli]
MEHLDDEGQYLAERASLFFEFLDTNELLTIFPYRKEAWADLQKMVEAGSKRRLRILNNSIDEMLIGPPNSLGLDFRYEILRLFDEKLGEGHNALIHKMMAVYDKIIEKGTIDSRNLINTAIAILNSEMLALSPEQKEGLKEIINQSVMKR